MQPKINIVTIHVKNLDLSTRFYREVFALPEDKISSGDDHVAFFLEGEISLVLYERSGFAQMAEQHEDHLHTSGVIFSHTAKDPKEVNAILSSALQAGGTIWREGTADDWGYTGLFKDIDGYTWEVMSWLEADDTHTIEVQREYKHTPEIIYKAWTSPQTLKKLFGLTDIEMDVRVGGRKKMSVSMHDEIQELYHKIIDAWNNRDAQGMADQFSEQGVQIGFDGSKVVGKVEILTHLTPIFEDHPTARL